MTDPLWHTQPILIDYSDADLKNNDSSINTKTWDAVKNDPISVNREEDWYNLRSYIDIESGEWVRGIMEKNLAYEHSMAFQNDRGIYSRNIANDRLVSLQILGGRNINKYDDTVLGIDPEHEKMLRDYGAMSKWNIKAATESSRGTPFLEYLYQTPEDLFSIEQKGWKLSDALEFLQKGQEDGTLGGEDTQLWARYTRALGGEGAIKETVEGSRNAIEFWYKLNMAVTNRAHSHAVAMHNQFDSGFNQFWTKSKSFVVNGILNDPDMAASLGMGAALNLISGGTLGTAIFVASKVKRAKTALDAIASVNKLGKLAKFNKGVLSATRYLPENIGPTLLHKTIFKGVAATPGLTLGKVATYSIGNALEGYVSGGLAEIRNQYHRVGTGVQDEANWEHIWLEAKYEAVFSPFINPIMGGLMMMPAHLAKQSMHGALQGFGETYAGPELYSHIKTAFQDSTAIDPTIEALTSVLNLRQKIVDKTGLAFQDDSIFSDKSVGNLLSVVSKNINISPDEMMEEIGKEVDNIDPSSYIRSQKGVVTDTPKTISLPALYVQVFRNIARSFGLKDSIQESVNILSDELALNARITERAAELGVEVKAYKEKILEDENFFDLLDPETQQRIAEEHGEGFEKLSSEDKIQAAINYQERIVKENAEAVAAIMNKAEDVRKTTKNANDEAQEIRDQNKIANIEGISTETKTEVDKPGTLGDTPKVDEVTPKDPDSTVEQELEEAEPVTEEPDSFGVKGAMEESSEAKENIRALNKLKAEKTRSLKDGENADKKRKDIEEIDTVTEKLEDQVNKTDEVLSEWAEEEGENLQHIQNLLTSITGNKVIMNLKIKEGKEANKKILEFLNADVPIQVHQILTLAQTEFTEEGIVHKKELYTEDLSEDNRDRLRALIELLPKDKEGKAWAKKIRSFLNGSKWKVRPTIKEGLKTVRKQRDISSFATYVRILHNDTFKKLRKTKEYKEYIEARSDYLKAVREYNKEHNKAYQAKYSRNRDLWITLQSWREVGKMKKDLKADLKTRERLFNQLIKGYTNDETGVVHEGILKKGQKESEVEIQYTDFIHLLAKGTTEEQLIFEAIQDAENEEVSPSTMVTIDIAREMLELSWKEARGSITDLSPGSFRYLRQNPRNLNQLKGKTVADSDQTEFMFSDLNEEELVSQTDIGNLKEFGRNIVEEADAYATLLGEITVLESVGKARGRNGGIYNAIVYGIMPQYLKDRGIAPFELFRDAIIDNGIINKESEAIDLLIRSGSIEYRYDLMLETIQMWSSRIAARNENWNESLLHAGLEQRIDQLLEGQNAESVQNLVAAELLLGDLSAAKHTLDSSLWDTEGFIIHIDKSTGKITTDNGTKDKVAYVMAVEEAMGKRLEQILLHPTRARKLIEGLLQKHPDIFSEDFKTKDLDSQIIELNNTLLSTLKNNLDKFYGHPTLPSVTLAKFGTGELGRHPANSLGFALIDFLDPANEIHSTNPLELDPHAEHGDNTIYSLDKGESVKVVSYRPGELNEVAPTSLIRVGKIIAEARFRARVKAIIAKKELTKKERKFVRDWVEKEIHDPKAAATGLRLPMTILPKFVGGSFRDRIISRPQLEAFLTDIFLNMPHIGISTIFDSIAKKEGTLMNWRDGSVEGAWLANLTVGSRMAVPFSEIPMVLAVESMNPVLSGLSKATVEQSRRIREAFEREGVDFREMFDPSHRDDRNYNVYVVWKLMSLLADPSQEQNIKDLIQNIEHGFVDKDGNKIEGIIDKGFQGNKEDYYITKGLALINEVLGKNLNSIATFRSIFKDVQGFKTIEEWNTWAEEGNDAKSKALRDFLKIPLMRRAYRGGFAAFLKDFQPQRLANFRKTGIKKNAPPGIIAILKLEEAYGIEFTEGEIRSLGQLILDTPFKHHLTLVDAALGLGEAQFNMVLDFLQLEGKDILSREWETQIEESFGKTLDKNNPIYKTENLERQLEAVIHRIAAKERITVKAAKKKYATRYEQTKKFIQKVKKERGPDHILPGTPAYKMAEQMMLGLRDKNGKFKKGGRQLWRSQAYFRSLNAHNASVHRINKERMKELVDLIGIEELYSEEDFLGLVDELVFHTALPSSGSNRAIQLNSGLGTNTQGTWVERVAIEAPRWKKHLEDNLKMISDRDYGGKMEAVLDQDQLLRAKREIFVEFMEDKDNRDAFGMFDLENNPYDDPIEFAKWLEDTMIKHELLQYAEFGPPPFADYTIEDNDGTFLQNFFHEWQEHSVTMPDIVEKQRSFENQILQSDSLKGLIDLRSTVLGGVFDPRISAKSDAHYLPYSPHAIDYGIIEQQAGEFTTISTDNPRGPLSMQALYKRHSYHRQGIAHLQRLGLKNQIEARIGPYQDMLNAEPTSDAEAMMPDGYFGWAQPWKQENLPKGLGLTVEENRLFTDTGEVGRLAIKAKAELFDWARDLGIEEQVKKNPNDIPYYFNLMRADKVRASIVKRESRGKKELSPMELRIYRNQWILELHAITELSRMIKRTEMDPMKLESEGYKLAVSNPERLGDMDYADIFLDQRTATRPEGTLFYRTNLHEQIQMGPIAKANVMFSVDGKVIAAEDLLVKELHFISSPVQGLDMSQLILSNLYTLYIGDILKEGTWTRDAKLKTLYQERDIWRNPSNWLFVEEEHQKLIIDEALRVAREEGGLNLEFDLIPELLGKDQKQRDKINLILKNAPEVTHKIQGKKRSFTLRSPLSEQGFGMISIEAHKVRGKQVKLMLSMESALLIFMLNSNNAPIQRLQDAYHMKKALGTTFDSEGNLIIDKAPQEIFKDAVGFTLTEQIRNQVVQSDVIEHLMRNMGGRKVAKVRDIYGSIDGADIEVIDLDSLTTGTKEMAHYGIEVQIAPVSRMLEQINMDALETFNTDYTENVRKEVDSLKKKIKAIRSKPLNNEANIAILTMLSSLIDTANIRVDGYTVASHLDGIFLETENIKLIHDARKEANRIFQTLSPLWDTKGDWSINPLYPQAREFLWQQPETFDPVEKFIASVEHSENRTMDDAEKQTAEIALALAIGTDMHESANAPNSFFNVDGILGTDRTSAFTIYSKSYNSFKKFIAITENNKDLKRLNEHIESGLVETGLIDTKTAQIFRSMIIRMWEHNQLSLEDVHLYVDTAKPYFGTAERTDGRYIIKIGEEALKATPQQITSMLAHELAHISVFKFLELNSPDYRRWETLMYSPAGRDYLKKMVVAWHGGDERNPAAKEMINYFLEENNIHEFMAGMVQFHLLNGVSPVANLSAAQSMIDLKSLGLVRRLMGYVRDTFVRLQSVFTLFEKDNPKLKKEIDMMVERILGWDSRYKEPVRPAIKHNEDMGPMDMRLIQPRKEMDIIILDAEYEIKIAKLIDVEDKYRELLNVDIEMFEKNNIEYEKWLGKQNIDFKEIDPLIENHKNNIDALFHIKEKQKTLLQLDGDHYPNISKEKKDNFTMTTGISRYQFFRGKVGLTQLGFLSGNHLDIEAMLSFGLDQSDLFATATEILLQNITAKYGDPVTGGAGQAVRTVLEKVSEKFWGKEGRHKLGQFMMNATVSATGANHTHNSHILLIQMLSVLLDNRVVHTTGDYNNIAGSDSITTVFDTIDRLVEEIQGASDEIKGELTKIDQVNGKTIEGYTHDIVIQSFKLTENPNSDIILKKEIDNKEIRNIIKTSAKSFRKSLDYFIELGKKTGLHGEGFEVTVPYMLNEKVSGKSFDSFAAEFKASIQERLLNEENYIDPVSLFFINYLPTYTDKDIMVSDIERLQNTAPGIFKIIVDAALNIEDSQYFNESEKVKPALRRNFLASLNEMIEARGGMMSTPESLRAREILAQSILNVMKQMQLKQLTWDDLSVTPGIKQQYFDAIRLGSPNAKKLQQLNAKTMKVPYHIFFQAEGRQRARFGGEDGKEIETILDLHFFNFINKATLGLYHPNESWTVPRISDISENEIIMNHIVTDPARILETHKKSTGDVILERQFLKDHFGITATYENVLDLIEITFDSNHVDYKHADGRSMNDKDKADLRVSLDHLRAKHDVVRGIVRRSKGTSVLDEWGMQIAPHVAKLAFGGNLAFASMLVEGFTGVLHELLGRHSIKGAVRGIMLPMFGKLLTGTEERRVLARDLAHVIKAATHGRYVDFESPASAVEQKFLVAWTERMGNRMLMPAKFVMSGIAASRAISARFFIQDNFGKIVDLAGRMGPQRINKETGRVEDNPDYKPFDPKDPGADRILKDHMREVGIAGFNWTLVQYIVQSGILSDINLLKTNTEGNPSLESFLKIHDQRDYYSPTMLMEHTNRNDRWGAASPEYHKAHKIIGALRYIEKSFIEEVLIAPNAFDVATGTRKKGDSWSQGPFDIIWEVFQRYPMLFVAQHVVRKSTGWHPTKYGMNLLSLLILDTLYMLLLRISAGEPWEHILEEWEESPFETSIKYGVRLPVLGRYAGIVAQSLQQSYSQFSPGGKGGFIAVSAAEVLLRDVGRAAASSKNLVFGDEQVYGSDFLNLIKHIPFLGETYGRGAFYLMADHIEAPSFAKPVTEWFGSKMALRRGKRKGKGGIHQGIPAPLAGFSWETMMHQMGQELFPGLTHVSELQDIPGVQPQQVRTAPEKPVETVRETKDPVARLLDESPYTEAPGGLKGN